MAALSLFSVGNSTLFQYSHYDHKVHAKVYTLNAKELSDTECHLFFPTGQLVNEHLITTTLEYYTFHFSNRVMNAKFQFRIAQIENCDVAWVSFPKEFKDVCQRIATAFNMTMRTNCDWGFEMGPSIPESLKLLEQKDAKEDQNKPKIEKTALTRVEDHQKSRILFTFPKTEKILAFDGIRCHDQKLLGERIDQIIKNANYLNELTVD